MIRVVLTRAEVHLAWGVAGERFCNGLSSPNRLRESDRQIRERCVSDVNGAAGELAAAKGLRLYWPGSTERGAVDIPPDVQVRTRPRRDWDLAVHKTDADDERFVLVVGIIPVFDVVGWIWGRDAKRDEWFHARGPHDPEFWVPQSALTPFGAVALADDS